VREGLAPSLAATLLSVSLVLAMSPTVLVAGNLEVLLVDGRGEPLDRVEVSVRGSGLERTLDGGLLGRLALDLPSGVYDLGFSKPDFYDLSVEGVAIDLPSASRSGREAFAPLRVMMTRRINLEKDLQIVGPRFVDPPPLEISFRPESPAVVGRSARGVVTLKNVGLKSLRVPASREFHWTPEVLTMRLVMTIEGSDVALDEPFLCTPSAECRELSPGESVEISVSLNSRRGYSEGRSESASWQRSGDLKGTIGVYFTFPQGGAEVPTITRSSEATFQMIISESQ